MRDSTERSFEAYRKPLETVATFKYLGRVMTALDDNWPAVAGNLGKSTEELGTAVTDFEQGRGGQEVIRRFI